MCILLVCYGYIKLQRNAASSMFPCLVYFSVLYRCRTLCIPCRQHVASNICICNHSTPQECALPLYNYFEHAWLCFFCLFVFYYWHWFQADIKPSTYSCLYWGNLNIYAFPVGQGDYTVVQCPLIDNNYFY